MIDYSLMAQKYDIHGISCDMRCQLHYAYMGKSVSWETLEGFEWGEDGAVTPCLICHCPSRLIIKLTEGEKERRAKNASPEVSAINDVMDDMERSVGLVVDLIHRKEAEIRWAGYLTRDYHDDTSKCPDCYQRHNINYNCRNNVPRQDKHTGADK